MTTRVIAGILTAALVAAGALAAGQTAKTSRVMKQKLTYAQRILEALTTSNYQLLDQQAEALSRVVDSPEWDELKTPEFRGYTDRFSDAANQLLAAAKQRDLDTAAARYEPLVASCYACHRYRKLIRIVQ
jgi:hypothetical protein